MNEKITDDFVDQRRQNLHPEFQIVRDLYEDAIRRLFECPDDVHSFCKRFQMMKAHFAFLAINDLLGGPRDRNSGARRRHHNDVTIRTALEIVDVTVVR